MKHQYAIGTDIGGSHISCAAVDLATGTIRKETLTERAVDNKAEADVIISTWAGALAAVIDIVKAENIRGIGFAMPGPFDYVKGTSFIKGVDKYEDLYGLNIGELLSAKLQTGNNFLMRYMNDASSFAVGEAWAGKAAGYSRSLSITLGTGFGSAFISDRIPVVDGTEVPRLGCVYHLPYKDGIADDSFSTRGLLKRYKTATGRSVAGVKELAALAAGDAVVRSIFDEFGDSLGVFLTPWLKSFGAEILVIGGNISYAYNLFGNQFESRLAKEDCNCKVALSELKEDAALLGSAYLFNDDFWKAVQHALPLM